VKLSGLQANRTYRLLNKDTGETTELSGKNLMEGLTLTSPQPRSSLLLKYELSE
jgi:hypothetical protein